VSALTNFKNTVALRWHTLDESWRYAITVFVIARLLLGIWSWVVFLIQPVAVQNIELSGEPILSVFELKDSQRHVYLREINGETLIFRVVGTDLISDQQTGSVWRISDGKAIQGPLAGQTLADPKTGTSDIFPYHGAAPYSQTWLAIWQRFDANWYVSIAENGYGSITGDIHFPPFYPLLMRLFKPVFQNAFLGGVVISHLATLYALKLLYDVFLQWGERPAARRALLYFVIYPTFFFCFSAYTEPVFLVATLLSLQAMSSRSWGWAGLWIFCAILVRLQGVALLAPMLIFMWRDPPFLRKPAHWAGLIVAGTAGLFYLYLRSLLSRESTLPFVESDLHARLASPWESFRYAFQTIFQGSASFVDILNLAVAILFIVLVIWGWKKIPLEYNIYTLCSMLIIVTRVVETQPLVSLSRYSLTFFPVFYTLALAGNQPVSRRIIVYTSILLTLYLSGQFFIWGWVA
jgi:hypothetical protein